MKENKENSNSRMVQVRKNSVAVKNYIYSSKPILYFLDCILSLFILPLLSTVFWFSVDYLYLYKISEVRIQVIVVCFSAVFYIILHTASKSIYRFVLKHATESRVRFHFVSKAYIYVSGVLGVIVFDGVDIFFDLNEEWAKNIWINIGMVIIGFANLFCMKCYLHLAGFGDDVDHESTPEEVFLFPFRIFQFSVLFTEHVGNRFIYLFSSRLYTEIFGIASVSSWYGIWTAFDIFAGGNTSVTIVIVIVSYVGLFCTKTVRNITASPFAIITDREQGYFDVPTLFQWSFHWKKNKLLYLLDSIFSVFIVGTLVILVWRGAWCILDRIIIFSDDLQSAWASLVIGYALVILTFSVQPLMKKLMRKYNGWKRLSALDTYIIVSFCGTINVWRGIWMLLDNYIDMDHSLRMSLALHFGSFFILVIFNASNTLLVRGVYIDADESGDECVEFPCYYFRLRFQTKQKEKMLEELNKLNIAQRNLKNHDNTNDISLSQNVTESVELTTIVDEKLNSALRIENEKNKCENDEPSS